jgi:hypothetical protein
VLSADVLHAGVRASCRMTIEDAFFRDIKLRCSLHRNREHRAFQTLFGYKLTVLTEAFEISVFQISTWLISPSRKPLYPHLIREQLKRTRCGEHQSLAETTWCT